MDRVGEGICDWCRTKLDMVVVKEIKEGTFSHRQQQKQ